MKNTRICTRCVMTNEGDASIRFNKKGECNYCTRALSRMDKEYLANAQGEQKLKLLLEEIKQKGATKKYDCIMGISGGLDSSYVLYLGAKWGLRILAVHIDDGFDTELAAENIRRLVEKCNVKLITIKPDEKEFNDLTLSFMKASVPNIAIPQDNVLFAALYRFAKENEMTYFLSGFNFVLESILQNGNTHIAYDVKHIHALQKKFGKETINKLSLMSYYEYLRIRKDLGIKKINPLNYIDYNKARALKELEEFCGYKYYEAKHHESILTRFLQCYWLPKKFNVDKRTSHLSSIIVAGQMTREEALLEMKKPPIRDEVIKQDIKYIINKLCITQEEFEKIMALPPRQHKQYKTDSLKIFCINFLMKIKGKLKYKRKK